MKRLIPALTLPLLLAACNPENAPGASRVTVTSSKLTANLGTADTNTTYTFTSVAGSKASTINSATLSWTDATGGTKTATADLTTISLPSGFTCGATGSASCNFNDASTTPGDRSVAVSISDAILFSKFKAANPSVDSKTVNVQFNGAANSLPFTVTTAVQSNPGTGSGGTTTEKAPIPLVNINTTGTQPYSGTLSVTVSGNYDVTSKVKSLVLQVTDAKGNTDNTTHTSTNPSATFSIDTTRYSDGTLTIKAIALTESGLRGESTAQEVKIQNVSAPTMQILSPDSGSTLSGPATVRVQIRQSTTSFTLSPIDAANNDVRLDVRDYRGQVVKTVTGKALVISEGILEAFIPLDLIGPEFSSNAYTITATAQAKLADGTTRSLNANTSVTTEVNDNKPPALSILMPAYITDPYTNTGLRGTFTRNSAMMLQASDDNGVTSIRVDLTCDEATKTTAQTCPRAPYTYNIPVNQAGVFYRVFELGAQLDGQPYVQDGNYTLRVTAFDGSKANIQEFPIRISRQASASQIAGLSNGVLTTTVPDTRPGQLNPTSATWTIPGQTTNPVRIATLAYDQTMATLVPSRQRIDPVLPAGTTISLTQGFNKAGTYRIDFIVEDLVTGVVRYYQGGEVVVKENP